ncbi:MAG: diguanylate cyclase [Candidatus Methylomirabilales bacterium]
MGSWEETAASVLHIFRLDSIKSKILVFALLATLTPSITMGWLSYVYNKRSLTAKVTEELRNVTSHTTREIDIWLKERFYDVRVFSSSYEVSENLEKVLDAQRALGSDAPALRRLKDYLNSVRKKFVHYEELLVLDPEAHVVASSAGQPDAVKLPPDWLQEVKKDTVILGHPYWDNGLKQTVMMIAVPIKAANDRFLGAFAAKLNFHTVDGILKSFSLGHTGQVSLITGEGALIISSQIPSRPPQRTKLAPATVRALLDKESAPLEYTDDQGKQVLGTLKPLPQLDWAVVAEIGKGEAYAQFVRLWNLTFLMVSGLLLGIGLTAYLLGVTIVRPLDRLTDGAAKVAAGDLEVDLPVVSRGEVGYMTEVFNHMVARLRQGREALGAINKTLSQKNKKLEELSITDGLTGLHNRSHLMETLTKETTRARRLDHPFSVLMIDIDHFKRYNDSFGHLAGDAVLTKMASIFIRSIRSVEYAARYGGEEFLVMLPETEPDGALEAAERIRTRVFEETFDNGSEPVGITISIGVAGFPEHGDTPESVIASADAALYEAKRSGRNRVIRASAGQRKKTGRRAPPPR